MKTSHLRAGATILSHLKSRASHTRHFIAKSAMVLGLVGAAAVSLTTAPSYAQEQVTVWWNKGYYQAEDDAIRSTIEKFQKETGIKVNLSLYSQEDIVTKSIAAVEAGDPPDVGFGSQYDLYAFAQWASLGKLEPVDAIVTPLKDTLLPVALEGIQVVNTKTGKRSFYGLPISANMGHIFYWRDMLEQAGFKSSDIPTKWGDFWNFWCDKVHNGIRAKGLRVYGVGNPTSVTGDTFAEFMVFMAAYDTTIVKPDGSLTTSDPVVRGKLIQIIKEYVGIYTSGCTPPSSITWNDSDNNTNLNNRTTVMTPNASLSIPGSWLDKKDDDVYYNKLVTADLPYGVNGKPFANPTRVQPAVVFADAKNKAGAQKFLAYLARPENYDEYVRASLGRQIPVVKRFLTDPFWASGKDPHRAMVAKLYANELQPMPMTYNYKISKANSENVWAKAMLRVIQDKVSPEQAVDEMIKRLNEIVAN